MPKHNNKKHQKKCGGDSQAWTSLVTQGYPHQAESANSNHIKLFNPPMNQSGGFGYVSSPGMIGSNAQTVGVTTPGSAPIAPRMVGGNQQQQHYGGYGFSDLAIPAVLLIANQKYGNKTGKKYKNYKKRFSRRRRSSRFF